MEPNPHQQLTFAHMNETAFTHVIIIETCLHERTVQRAVFYLDTCTWEWKEFCRDCRTEVPLQEWYRTCQLADCPHNHTQIVDREERIYADNGAFAPSYDRVEVCLECGQDEPDKPIPLIDDDEIPF